jgi:hypothetical protein
MSAEQESESAGAPVKDLIDKFGLNEFIVFLCPGVFFLCSLTLWVRPDFSYIVGEKLADKPAVVGPVLLVLAYTMGLLLSSWSVQGAQLYLRLAYRRHSKVATVWQQASWCCLIFVHGLRTPYINPGLVRQQMRISTALARYGGLFGVSGLETPWDRLTIYRTLVSGRLSAAGLPILQETETVHRRLLFTLAMAFVFLLIAVQAVARWIIERRNPSLHFPAIPAPVLPTLAIVGLLASIGLRLIASRWWERELLLTCSLAPDR